MINDMVATKLNGEFTIVSLESGTCTDIASDYFSNNFFEKQPQVVYTKSFDEGVSLATQNKGHLLLIPHIHHLCGFLESDSNWLTHNNQVFSLKNPPLFLAKSSKHNMTDKACAVLPTLKNLIDDDFDFIEVNNTQEASQMVANGECSYCVTNKVGLDKNNLTPIKKLKEMTILWIPFEYRR